MLANLPVEMESSRTDVFVDAFEYLPEEMESSRTDVFVDAFECLPEEMESSRTDVFVGDFLPVHRESSSDLFVGDFLPVDRESSSDLFVGDFLPVDRESSSDLFVGDFLPEEMESSSSNKAQPSTSAATDPPVQNNPAEKHTKGRKGRSRFQTAGKALKRDFRTFMSKVFPCVPARKTPATDPAEPTDLNLMFPNEPTLQHEYFQSLYKVGKKLSYGDRFHKGIRRSDGQKVVIKFVERRTFWGTLDTPVDEGTTLLKLQKPTRDYITRLYDRFFMEDQYVLIMEHLPAYVTLREFIRRKRGSLTEETVTRIMRQIVQAMDHCMNYEVFHPLNLESILINPKTLMIKFADFDEVHFERSESVLDEVEKAECFFGYILDCLTDEIRTEEKVFMSEYFRDMEHLKLRTYVRSSLNFRYRMMKKEEATNVPRPGE